MKKFVTPEEEKAFAQRLRTVMESAGDKPKDLAAKVGSKLRAAQGWLTGTIPEAMIVTRIAQIYGVTERFLLTGQESPAPELVVQENPIALSAADQFVPVPLVDEQVAAGPASEIGPEEIKDWVVVHRPTVGKKASLVAVRIRGDSMHPAIPDGAIVIVDRKDRKIRKGRIYVVRLDGGVTAKYVERDGKELILIPENREHREQRIKIREGEESPIIGSVIWKWQSMV